MPDQAPRTGWAKLCTGLAIAAFELVSDCLHPEVTEILVIADLAIPVITFVVLLIIIARSKEQTCERIFRLLRWIVNRPEPPVIQTVVNDLHERLVIYHGALDPAIKPSGEATRHQQA
jgi:hypothetical protein